MRVVTPSRRLRSGTMLRTRPVTSSAGAPSAGWSRARTPQCSCSAPAWSLSTSIAPERAIPLSLLPDVAALYLPAVALHRERRRDAGVGTEVHREPAVVVRSLPVARTPGAIAQAEAVDRPAALADAHASDRVSVLLEVAARELLSRPLRAHALPAPVALLAQLAAVSGGQRRIGELDARGHVRILRERRARIEQIERAAQHARVAPVRDVMLAHRRTHLELHPAGVEARVVGDLRPAEHEARPCRRAGRDRASSRRSPRSGGCRSGRSHRDAAPDRRSCSTRSRCSSTRRCSGASGRRRRGRPSALLPS